MLEPLFGLHAPLDKSTALVFVNGFADALTLERCRHFSSALLVCVDGGLRHCRAIDAVPDILIGDLDSASPEDVSFIEDRDVTILKHPADKDATDLELALQYLATESIEQIVLVGLAGGRLDQMLANFALLCARLWPFQVGFMDADGDGIVITASRPFEHRLGVGHTISLLACSPEVTGLNTRGLRYALHDHTLAPGSTLGISNISNEERVSVSVATGNLLLLLNHQMS